MAIKKYTIIGAVACSLFFAGNALACGGGGGGGGAGTTSAVNMSSSNTSVPSGGSTASAAAVAGPAATTVSVGAGGGGACVGQCAALMATVEVMMEKLLSVSYSFAAMEDALDANSTGLATDVVVQMLSISNFE